MAIGYSINGVLNDLKQKGLIERTFYAALFPGLHYRSEASFERWEANVGEEIYQTRRGLLTPKVTPLTPGVDPQPSTYSYEQWKTTMFQYGDAIDTNMPESVVSAAELLLSDIHTLGLGAAQSVNRVVRNALFTAYLSGNTVMTAASSVSDVVIFVASLTGFTDVILSGVQAQPQIASLGFPLPITVGAGTGVSEPNSVVGFVPNDPSVPLGPGMLLLATPLSNAHPARSAVISAQAPIIIRSAAGSSVDAIGPSDTLVLQQSINIAARLRRANVQPHPDGYYHCHISPLTDAQHFTDPVFQRLHQSLPNGEVYAKGWVNVQSGIAYIMNNESPELASLTLPTISTGSGGAVYSPEIGGEMVNGQGVQIGRMIVTGRGAIYERGLDEENYKTDAGTTGKTAEFNLDNDGVNIPAERIRLTMRAPLDRLQQKVSNAWSISMGIAIPSDVLAQSGPQRYKRAIAAEHALQ